MNPKAEAFFNETDKWKEELRRLRKLLLGCQLAEAIKWGKPCYTFQDRNVVLLVGFKNYCSLMFCKGSLLKDAKGILVKAGENTQAARQVRFTNLGQIVAMEPVLKGYVQEAIEVERAGLEVDYKLSTALVFPEEFQKELAASAALKKAFNALTPGRRRAYNLYFSSAKQSTTRTTRVARYRQQILDGKGIDD